MSEELIGKIYDRLLLVPTRQETEQIVARGTKRCRRIQSKRCGITKPPAPAPATDRPPWDFSWLKAIIPAAILLGTILGAALGWVPSPAVGNQAPPQIAAPKGGNP